MQIDKRTKTLNIICVCLVLFAGVIRLIAKPTGLFVYNSLIFTLLTFTIAIWIFQLKKRLLQPDVKRNLISAASIMIFWMAIRTIKYDFLPDKHFTLRYAWYLYYIPMVLIPLLIFLSVLAIGLPHDKPINRLNNELKELGNVTAEENAKDFSGTELLSKREKEVMELLIKGKKRKEIAEELFVTESTIKKHSASIYRKLDVGNKKELFEKVKSEIVK